jgi:hypothetical protein
VWLRRLQLQSLQRQLKSLASQIPSAATAAPSPEGCNHLRLSAEDLAAQLFKLLDEQKKWVQLAA